LRGYGAAPLTFGLPFFGDAEAFRCFGEIRFTT
jgi:hypothetical protein